MSGLLQSRPRSAETPTVDGGDYWAVAPVAPAVAGEPAASWSDTRRPPTRGCARLLLGVVPLLLAAVLTVGHTSPQAAAAGRVVAVTQPAPFAKGWSAGYVDERGRPGRWDPCTPISYVVDEAQEPAGGRADLREALARISAVSGLRFRDEGASAERPSLGRQAYQPTVYGKRWAPLLISWISPASTDLGLGSGVQGVSLAVAVPDGGGPSIVSGQVAIDADHRLAAGFGPGTTDGEVLLHELGHAVGLGHVLDPTQVMYPQTTDSESAYGAGDRAGLVALGAAAGCHRAPSARPVRTTTLDR